MAISASGRSFDLRRIADRALLLFSLQIRTCFLSLNKKIFSTTFHLDLFFDPWHYGLIGGA